MRRRDDQDEAADVSGSFRRLCEAAERKFARVRDVPSYARARELSRLFQKLFKAYTALWTFQRLNRSALVSAGLRRWEIGEIASRIGQLYFTQYLRTSQSRFLLESYVFYHAILTRNYFADADADADAVGLALRLKELRFLARFVVVALLLNRFHTVHELLDRFKAVLDHTKAKYAQDSNFKEWRQLLQEVAAFMKEISTQTHCPPLRCLWNPNPNLNSFRRALKLREALVSTYHRKELKLGEFTLDTFRIMQALEWEPTHIDTATATATATASNHSIIRENGHSGPSTLIDINLAADSASPPNPRKALLYRPCVTHLIALLATICEELPPDSVMLLYLSASSGKAERNVNLPSSNSCENNHGLGDDAYLWFGPRGHAAGSNNLYPGDIIPFTRRPLFLIVDSDISHAFKVLHGAERGEPAALLLSPSKPAFKKASDTESGSQFTFFLTSPVAALFQMLALSDEHEHEHEHDVYNDAEDILSAALSEWELILCSSPTLHLAWAQVLSDPFLRRLILRFIFCRSVLFFFSRPEDRKQCLPTCLPSLPNSVSPDSQVVRAAVLRLAKHLRVDDCFHF